MSIACRFLATSSVALTIGLMYGSPANAEEVVCHYTYGGETRLLRATPVDSAYSVRAIEVGSYFRFRIIFQNRPADLAAIKIYTYADRDDGSVLVHQASYPYPPIRGKQSTYGFSGLQYVYEPVRDGELQYWCEWKKSKPGKALNGRQA